MILSMNRDPRANVVEELLVKTGRSASWLAKEVGATRAADPATRRRNLPTRIAHDPGLRGDASG